MWFCMRCGADFDVVTIGCACNVYGKQWDDMIEHWGIESTKFDTTLPWPPNYVLFAETPKGKETIGWKIGTSPRENSVQGRFLSL